MAFINGLDSNNYKACKICSKYWPPKICPTRFLKVRGRWWTGLHLQHDYLLCYRKNMDMANSPWVVTRCEHAKTSLKHYKNCDAYGMKQIVECQGLFIPCFRCPNYGISPLVCWITKHLIYATKLTCRFKMRVDNPWTILNIHLTKTTNQHTNRAFNICNLNFFGRFYVKFNII